MSNKISINLCIDRLNSGKEKIRVCELLYKEGFYKDANNRAYYSIFNSIRAVLSLEPIDFKKHKDVIAYFNKNYVKPGLFPKDLGHKISIANSVREDSDYLDTYMVNKTQTKEQIETAKQMYECAKKHIIDWLNNKSNLSKNEIEKFIKSIKK